MNNKYPEYIMKYLRQRLNLDEDDTSKDEYLTNMAKSEILDEVCDWNGLIGFGSTIRGWVKDIWGIELEN